MSDLPSQEFGTSPNFTLLDLTSGPYDLTTNAEGLKRAARWLVPVATGTVVVTKENGNTETLTVGTDWPQDKDFLAQATNLSGTCTAVWVFW